MLDDSVAGATEVQSAVVRVFYTSRVLSKPRALCMDKTFRPIIDEIQRCHYPHMSEEFYTLSCDLVILDLSLNYFLFTNGDLAPYLGPGPEQESTRKEYDMITLFSALNRDEDEMRTDEVLDLARHVIIPLLKGLVEEYFKSNPSKRQREIAYSYRSDDAKRRCRSSLKESFVPLPPTTSLIESHLDDKLRTEALRTLSEIYIPPTPPGSFQTLSTENDKPSYDLSLSIPTIQLPPHAVSFKSDKQLSPLIASIPRSPRLGILRATNVQPASSHTSGSGSQKYLAVQKRLIHASRRSSTANKENIPPANYSR